MKRDSAVQWIIRVLATALAVAASVPAYAQGCAMCYNDAAAAKSTAIQALRSGTLILLFPVLLLFTGILLMAVRSSNRFNEAPGAEESGADGLAVSARTMDEWADPDGPVEQELLAAGTGAHKRRRSKPTAS